MPLAPTQHLKIHVIYTQNIKYTCLNKFKININKDIYMYYFK